MSVRAATPLPAGDDADRLEVAAALAGDPLALDRVIDRLLPVIQARVARRLLAAGRAGGSIRSDVEDLTQEILLSLVVGPSRVLARWDPGRGLSLRNFAGLVAERHTISWLRRRRPLPWPDDDPSAEGDPGPVDDAPDPERVAASREHLRLLLDSLVERLSPLGRRLFDLLFVQERPLAEVRAATGLSDDAVYAWRSRLRRLTRTVAAELMSETPDPRRTSP